MAAAFVKSLSPSVCRRENERWEPWVWAWLPRNQLRDLGRAPLPPPPPRPEAPGFLFYKRKALAWQDFQVSST